MTIKSNGWNRRVSLGLKALLLPGATKFERLFDSAQTERNRCTTSPKTKRLLCLLLQEPNNLRPMRPAKNRTDATQERRSLQSSGADARQVQKRNASSACCRSGSCQGCGRQKTGQMPLKNTAACDRAEQMHDPDPKIKRFCYLLPQEPNIL